MAGGMLCPPFPGWSRRCAPSPCPVCTFRGSIPLTRLPAPPPLRALVFSHFNFFFLHQTLFWGTNVSRSSLSCRLSFIPQLSQFPKAVSLKLIRIAPKLVKNEAFGAPTPTVQFNRELCFSQAPRHRCSFFPQRLYPEDLTLFFSLPVRAATSWPQFPSRCALLLLCPPYGALLTSRPVASCST